MSKMSRLIVVDASVARSAGDGVHPTSALSREFLLDMLTICHRLVTTPDVSEEWRKHASRFTIRWLAAMRSKRKVVTIVPNPAGKVREHILACSGFEPNQLAAMEKDVLLLEAAMSADRIVASGDRRVRSLFAAASVQVSEIASVIWVNPADEQDGCAVWLKAGARNDPAKHLGKAVR
jgi:hypothetical protein